MSEFEIKITSTLEGQGIKQTAGDLEKVASSATAADKSLAGTSTTAAKLGDSLEGSGHHAKEGAEGFKVLGSGAHEAHAGIRALSEAIPGLEQVSRFLANGLTATLGAAVFVFSKFQDAAKAAMDSLNDLAASPGAKSDYIERQRQAILESIDAQSSWEDQIHRLIAAQETLKDKTDELVAHQHGQIEAENEISQAQKALAEARVDLAVKLGQMTPEQAIKIKLEIDEQAFKEQAEIRIEEIQAELQARMNENTHNNAREPELNRNVETSKTAADAAASAKIRNESKLKQDQENLDASKARQEKAEKTVEDLDGKGTWGGQYDKSDPQYYQLQAAKNTISAEQNSQAGLRRSISQEQGKQPALDANAESAKADYEASKTAYEEATKEAKDLQKQMEKLRGDLDVEKAKAATLETLHNQTAATRAQGQTVDNERATRNAVESGRATPQQQQEFNDQQTRNAAAHETGASGAANIDASQTLAQGQILAGHLERQRPNDQSQQDLIALHQLLERLVGFMENSNVSPTLKPALDQLDRRLHNLQREHETLQSQVRARFSGNT